MKFNERELRLILTSLNEYQSNINGSMQTLTTSDPNEEFEPAFKLLESQSEQIEYLGNKIKKQLNMPVPDNYKDKALPWLVDEENTP
tara:strand:+ start:403 stop:663 length:261 start_codon:yes stop_codon:yes gene_type:complete